MRAISKENSVWRWQHGKYLAQVTHSTNSPSTTVGCPTVQKTALVCRATSFSTLSPVLQRSISFMWAKASWRQEPSHGWIPIRKQCLEHSRHLVKTCFLIQSFMRSCWLNTHYVSDTGAGRMEGHWTKADRTPCSCSSGQKTRGK